ncbi:5025_t:CDS:2, partial [Racocetra persica]
KRYRSPPFWRHKDLIPLVQGLEPVEEDETYELEEKIDIDMSVENKESNKADEDLVEQLNNETDDKLVDALEEYEGENDDFFEEVDESWEETDLLKSQEQYKDLWFLLVAKEAMNRIEKMLTKCKALKNQKKLPRTWKDCDKQTMFYKF